MTVSLEGDIDLSTAPAVRTALAGCRDREVTDIDVDLTAVGFCDASGLHAFLAASERLAAAKGCLRLHHPAPAVRRLLDLTGTGFLLADGRLRVEPPDPDSSQPSSGAA
ncbi:MULTISPECIES: STAS domain-containing protein [unclassified Streptomyces]|uniref:STAS domain-containing protein n=1 Tax=unclassified Streptomyces TaxID=2593676 RepID=UPI0035E2EAE9